MRGNHPHPSPLPSRERGKAAEREGVARPSFRRKPESSRGRAGVPSPLVGEGQDEGESPRRRGAPLIWFDKLTMSGGGLSAHHEPAPSAHPEPWACRTPLTLSLSKGLSGTKGWFDKLAMSGYAKVSWWEKVRMRGNHPGRRGAPLIWFDKLTMSGGGLSAHHEPAPSAHPEPWACRTPLTLSLSKGLSGTKGWFDKLTMSGYAKVSIEGEGASQARDLSRPISSDSSLGVRKPERMCRCPFRPISRASSGCRRRCRTFSAHSSTLSTR